VLLYSGNDEVRLVSGNGKTFKYNFAMPFNAVPADLVYTVFFETSQEDRGLT
jgi:hypothetical protein